MEALLLYQVKVAVLVAVLFAGYRLLLGRETFHRFNRLVLITIAILSFVLPLFHITRLVQPQPVFPPVADQTQVEADAGTIARNTILLNPVTILLVLYGAGVLYVLVKKGISVLAVSRIIRKGRYADRTEGVDVIESDQIPGPLNWMRYVVMPREWLESENASVWKHENLHAHRWHSLDLLMADLMTAFQWFNPVMILLRKEFELIHEYEADQAVIDSGANAKEYKLMLVNAVAASRGFAMTSWLKQSNLKKRIDMMDKKQSNGWNRLRVLFIPAIAYLFLFATANVTVANAQDFQFHWQLFEDSKTWIFQDGSAKVRTFDGVQADMKASEVADYLKNYDKYKVNRMTLMFDYPIESLADAEPYAEQLYNAGIRTNIATNEDMLARMEQPEFHLARVFDEGDGQYRFEVICNSHDSRLNRYFSRGSYQFPYKDLSITGNLDLMIKWINMFDGVAIAIYPQTMSCSDLERISQAAWASGKDQVSAVLGFESEFELKMFTTIHKELNLAAMYPGCNAADAIRKLNDSRSSDYFDKGVHIRYPKSFYNQNPTYLNLTDVVKTDNELILMFKSVQYTDLWVKSDGSLEIEINGQVYECSRYEGLDGYLDQMFWSPDNAYFLWTVHFDVTVPDDVKTINIIDSQDGNEIISGLQVSDKPIDYDNVNVVNLNNRVDLKTTHRKNDNLRDYVELIRIDFSDQETRLYAAMGIFQAPTFPGYLGGDITITLSDGQEIKATKVLGVPTDVDFDRHGDYMITYFKVIFPPIGKRDWEKGTNVFKANVCHEPVSIEMNKRTSTGFTSEFVGEIEEGRYSIFTLKQRRDAVNQEAWVTVSRESVENVTIDSKDKMTVSGSDSKLLPNGKYSLNWKEAGDNDLLEVKVKKVKHQFLVREVRAAGNLVQYSLIDEGDMESEVWVLRPIE